MAEPSPLDALTEDRIALAFNRAKAETDFAGVELMRITEEHFDAAVAFACEVFPSDEPVTLALGVSDSPDAKKVWMDTFKHNLSLMLVDSTTRDIVGIRATMVTTPGVELSEDNITDPGVRGLIRFMKACNSRFDIFKHFGTNKIIDFFGLGIASSHRKRGLGTQLMGAALKFLQHLEVKPLYVRGSASSNYSKKIYAKFDFETLSDNPYAEYTVDGVAVFKDTGEHTSMKVYAKRL